MKRVSILIPLYNSEQFIAATIDCCLSQTYPNIEIIVVDDGSTDNSYKIAKAYSSDNIHVFQQLNSGACRARNLAFEKSTGDYIMYLDADDLMSNDKVEKQMEVLSKHKDSYMVATCPYEEFTETINVKFTPRTLYKDYDCGLDLLEDAWANAECFVITCYLTSRHLIQGAGLWNENLHKNQDGEFFCRVLAKASKIRFCEVPKFYYRRGHESISTSNKWNNKNIQSSLDSRISYENTILPLRNTPRIKYGLARCYAVVMLNSPVGSFYYIESKRRILALGRKPFHPTPTKIIQIAEIIVGFENLLRFKKILMNLHLK